MPFLISGQLRARQLPGLPKSLIPKAEFRDAKGGFIPDFWPIWGLVATKRKLGKLLTLRSLEMTFTRSKPITFN
jgi:hypothetical protein